MSKSILYWLKEPEIVHSQFTCEDYDEFEQLIEVLARGRNVRGGHRTYKCGWTIVDTTGGEFYFTGTIQQAIIIQMMGYDI